MSCPTPAVACLTRFRAGPDGHSWTRPADLVTVPYRPYPYPTYDYWLLNPTATRFIQPYPYPDYLIAETLQATNLRSVGVVPGSATTFGRRRHLLTDSNLSLDIARLSLLFVMISRVPRVVDRYRCATAADGATSLYPARRRCLALAPCERRQEAIARSCCTRHQPHGERWHVLARHDVSMALDDRGAASIRSPAGAGSGDGPVRRAVWGQSPTCRRSRSLERPARHLQTQPVLPPLLQPGAKDAALSA